MIPLGLITGFLGSGKTTLLRRIVEANRYRRLVYVVNECGAVDIDGRLLDLESDRLVRIPGGSIFCRCLAGEFVDQLTRIGPRAADPEEPIAGVVVEASGITDPKVARQMLAETGLDRTYALRTIVSVVDPGSFLKLVHTLPNIVAQIETCGLAVINKIDLCDEESLSRTESAIHAINPAAAIVRATFGCVDVNIFAESPARNLAGTYAGCLDPNYASTTLWMEHEIDPAPLLAKLEGLRADLYRAKGFVPVVDGSLYVDLSGSGLTSHLTAERIRPGMLVLISRPQARPRIDQLVAGPEHLAGL